MINRSSTNIKCIMNNVYSNMSNYKLHISTNFGSHLYAKLFLMDRFGDFCKYTLSPKQIKTGPFMLLQSTATNNCCSFNNLKILKYELIFQIISIVVYVPIKNNSDVNIHFYIAITQFSFVLATTNVSKKLSISVYGYTDITFHDAQNFLLSFR